MKLFHSRFPELIQLAVVDKAGKTRGKLLDLYMFLQEQWYFSSTWWSKQRTSRTHAISVSHINYNAKNNDIKCWLQSQGCKEYHFSLSHFNYSQMPESVLLKTVGARAIINQTSIIQQTNTINMLFHHHQKLASSTKGRFLDLNWPVKLVLTDRFA